MEGIEFEGVEEPIYAGGGEDFEAEDLSAAVLSRFMSSSREDHQHLCAAVGAMAQELKDQKLPLSPASFFAATSASLIRLSPSPSDIAIVEALLTFLSMGLTRVSPAVVRIRGGPVSEAIRRILGCSSASEGVVKAGMRCLLQLLIVGDRAIWSSVEPSYGVLLGFVTDDRPKVREQSHVCLRDALQSFQGSPLLVSASEGIMTVFERALLLAGGSGVGNTTVAEKPRGASEVLYVLNLLKDCLPLMSMKFKNKTLKYFSELLKVRESIVTRHIMEILHALCYSPSSHVSPEVLLELLCSLALSVTAKDRSADGMASTARLLHVGTKKVYDLKSEICVAKLPSIFNSLGEILACEHEEAIYAAVEALNGLINTCIDESLIKQGIQHIFLNPEGEERRSGPTIIEKTCATIESLLGYQYSAVWDMSFQVVSAMFGKLGESSYFLMRGTIKSLEDMQKLPDEDLACRKQLHDCLGSVLRALGPEKFLGLLPLNLNAEDLSQANVWLLPVLKQYTIGANLSFFTHSIISMARLARQRAQKLEKEALFVSSRSVEGLVYSLWSLLPAFCNYPLDTAKSFEGLTVELCYALRNEPELRGIICSSLQILIQQNKRALALNTDTLNDEVGNCALRAKDHYTSGSANENLNAISSSAKELKILPVLFEIFKTSSKDSGGYLQATIHELASISVKKDVKHHFKKIIYELITATKKDIAAKQQNSDSIRVDSDGRTSHSLERAMLLDLAVSLLPGLDTVEINILYDAIRHTLKDEEGLLQKKAYKILSIILKEREEFLLTKLEELLKLMIDVLPDCHFSAKRHRLDSLYYIIVSVSKDPAVHRKSDIISSFLTEIILALKEANKKTRNRAYDLLVKIGHAYGDEEQGGKKENLQQFFNM